MDKMQVERGFTMVEIMIALVIVSVLAGLAIPSFFRTVEQSRSNEAITNLNIIHMGQKIYRLNNPSIGFWDGNGTTTILAVNDNLNIDISARFFDKVSIDAPTPLSKYTAMLKRNLSFGGGSAPYYYYAYTFTVGDPAPTCTKGGPGAAVPC